MADPPPSEAPPAQPSMMALLEDEAGEELAAGAVPPVDELQASASGAAGPAQGPQTDTCAEPPAALLPPHTQQQQEGATAATAALPAPSPAPFPSDAQPSDAPLGPAAAMQTVEHALALARQLGLAPPASQDSQPGLTPVKPLGSGMCLAVQGT